MPIAPRWPVGRSNPPPGGRGSHPQGSGPLIGQSWAPPGNRPWVSGFLRLGSDPRTTAHTRGGEAEEMLFMHLTRMSHATRFRGARGRAPASLAAVTAGAVFIAAAPANADPTRPATAAARSAAVLEEATGTAGIIRGTFLPDGAARSEISDETGASTITVPAAADGRVTVTSADGTEVGIGLPGSGAAAQQSDNGTIVDPDAHDSSEFGVQATADGVSALVSMKDVEAPTAGRQEHLSARRTADGPARNQQGDGRERREERKEDQGEHARHLEVQERQDLGGWSTGTGTWCRSAVTSERRTTTL